MKNDKNFIYLLICTGEDAVFNSTFKAICNTAFKKDPLISALTSDEYRKIIKSFLECCEKDFTKISRLKEGTGKLKTIKLQII